MKSIFLTAVLLLAASVSLFGQNSRYDAPFPSVASSASAAYLVANVPPNSPVLAVCNSPANQVPCTNYATTFDGFGNTCLNGAQDTPQPANTSSCQSTGDAQGNIGFWAPSGTYDYTVCIKNNCFGPYTITLGGSGGGGGGISTVLGTTNQINVVNGSTVPIISIPTNPIFPGNVTVGGLIVGGSITAFSQIFTSVGGNSGKIAQLGAISGTANSCFDGAGNVTNVGCAAPVASAAGVATELQFRNSSTGLLAADSTLFNNSSTHTLTVTNINVNGLMTWLNSFGLTSTIPISSACIPTVGMSSIGFDTAGALAQSVNGAACNEFATSLGQAIVGGPIITQSVVQPLGTSLNVNTLSNIRYVTPSYNWTQTLAVDWSATGAKTATLTPCPLGLDLTNNANQPYKVYLPTTNVEVAQVTGGTCTSGATTGTITFTTTVAHSASSNAIGSSTSGIQEAINDACGTGAAGNPNCHVVLPGTGANGNALQVYATIFVHCSRCLVEGDGNYLVCNTRDRCMFLGDMNSSNDFGGVTVRGLRFGSGVTQDGCLLTNTSLTSNVVTITTAGGCTAIKTGDYVVIDFVDSTSNAYWGVHGPVTVSGTSVTYSYTTANIASQATPGTISIENAIIEDNAFPGTMDNIKFTSGAGSNKFAEGLVIDNDQKATISGFDNTGGGLLCTANHCGSYVYSAGSTAATPVIYIDKSNISPQCNGNGVTNYANNTTSIKDTVIQGFGMWGVLTSTMLGSFGGTIMDNIYNEEGAGPCVSPYSGAVFSAAGVMLGSGGTLNIRGGEQPNGRIPQFANTGATQNNYFVVVHDVTAGIYSYPLLAGTALTNGAGTITGQFPHVPPATPGDTIQYDVIRMVPSTLSANGVVVPAFGLCTGGSTTACGSIIVGQAQCAGLICTFTDTASANTTSYTVNFPGWFPILNFWPGGMVVYGNGGTNVANTAPVFIDSDIGSGTSPWISVAGNLQPTFYVRKCYGNSLSGGAWEQCLEGDSHGNSLNVTGGLLLQNGGQNGMPAGVKGRLNFMVPPSGAVNQANIITLVDSEGAKTIATPTGRPAWGANDTWIGLDQATGGSTFNLAQLAFGAPVAISNYIGAQPNSGGTNFLERLTASLKTFKVPITTNSQINSTLATGSPAFVLASTTRIANLHASLNPDTRYCGTTGTCANTVLTNPFVVFGTATLSGGTLAYSGLPFASTSWLCSTWDTTTPGTTSSMVQVTDATHATITGTGTDVIGFRCDGN